METMNIRIRGGKVGMLVPWIKESFQEIPGNFLKSGEIRIFAKEEYYFRTGSNLLTLVIMDFGTPDRCLVSLVSGGGSVGLFIPISWNSENSANADFVFDLKAACQEYSLVIEEVPGPVSTGGVPDTYG
jgi:hypothetical protein